MRMRVMLAGTVMALALGARGAQAQVSATGPCCEPKPMPAAISVTGTGEFELTPDRATIVFATETRAATAAAAGQANARRQAAVIDTLKKMGIPAERIRTVGISISPEMVYPGNNQPPKVAGYVARNGVEIELRDKVDELGKYIDAALAKEANRVSSMRFSSSREEFGRTEALARAVARAKADAEAMARAAGGTLGRLLDMSAIGGYQPMYKEMEGSRVMAMRADAAPTPVEPGQLTVQAQVAVRWEFNPR